MQWSINSLLHFIIHTIVNYRSIWCHCDIIEGFILGIVIFRGSFVHCSGNCRQISKKICRDCKHFWNNCRRSFLMPLNSGIPIGLRTTLWRCCKNTMSHPWASVPCGCPWIFPSRRILFTSVFMVWPAARITITRAKNCNRGQITFAGRPKQAKKFSPISTMI